MGPNRKITQKFIKKFDSEVIDRQYFHRKTRLESQRIRKKAQVFDLNIAITFEVVMKLHEQQQRISDDLHMFVFVCRTAHVTTVVTTKNLHAKLEEEKMM